MKAALIGITLLLLGQNRALARDIGFVWIPNTDHTTGYNLYVRQAGATDWQEPVVIEGRETAAWTLPLQVGTSWEVTITAWTNLYEGQPITYQESGMAPSVFVAEEEGVPYVLNVQGFGKEQ